MAVGNTMPTKALSSKKRALEETPAHYEINPGVSTSNVLITDGKIICNKNGSPPSAKKPTTCSGRNTGITIKYVIVTHTKRDLNLFLIILHNYTQLQYIQILNIVKLNVQILQFNKSIIY